MSSYSQAMQRTWRENILFSALIELTYRCNLDCFFCYNDTSLSGQPLAFDEYCALFDDLRGMGTLNLSFSGGEPFAHPRFFDLGAKARDLGFVVRVKTNGHALRGRLLQRLIDEIDPFHLDVSLHGASAATHDRQTRVPGSFEQLRANLEGARAAGLRIRLNVPLTCWNEHEIAAIHALGDALGCQVQVDPQLTWRDNGDPEPARIAASPAGIGRLLRLQRERFERARNSAETGAATTDKVSPEVRSTDQPSAEATMPHKQCGAGSATATIDPYGNVYPCVQWRRRIGNVREHPVSWLWKRSGDLAEIRTTVGDVKRSVDALKTPGFSLCPGLAEQETGSPVNIYSSAKVLLDLRRRMKAEAERR